MRYFVIPESLDGCEMATMPDAVPVEHIGMHIKTWLARFRVQGYFSNCKQERIPLGELGFRLEPELRLDRPDDLSFQEPRTNKATV